MKGLAAGVKKLSIFLALLPLTAILFPLTGAMAAGTEMLENPGFEEGISPYIIHGEAGSVLEESTSIVHSGKKAIVQKNRHKWWDDIAQDIIDQLEENGKGYYDVSAWARLGSGSDAVEITVKVIADESGEKYISTGGEDRSKFTPANSTSWAHISDTLNITWEGELLSACFYVETKDSIVDLYVDDVSMKKAGSTPATPTPKATATTKATVTQKATATPKGAVATATPKGAVATATPKGAVATAIPSTTADAGTPTQSASSENAATTTLEGTTPDASATSAPDATGTDTDSIPTSQEITTSDNQNAEDNTAVSSEDTTVKDAKNSNVLWIVIIIVAVLVIALLLVRLKKKKK